MACLVIQVLPIEVEERADVNGEVKSGLL